MHYLLLFIFLLSACGLSAQVPSRPDQGDEVLENAFTHPPANARPQTWWHWLNGNIRREGITADLEAMQTAGITAFQLFNIGLELPFGGISYLSEEWLDLVHFSAQEADRLGLKMGIHNSAGWSSSGGPWITPAQAMQEVVYRELTVTGGQRFADTLPKPPVHLGFYRDIAILAFPTPAGPERIEGLAYKSLAGKIRNHLSPDTSQISAAAVIHARDIIDLTDKVSADGVLHWAIPTGEWTILRLGYTPIGTRNRPAMQGGSGLECDKMSTAAVKAHWQHGVQPILDKLDTLVGRSLTDCLIDSYEVETTNWTADFPQEFRRLRGYDLLRYLPTLAGFYVESGEVSERFLWDFRRTVGDLIAENYYGTFRELCHQNGLSFSLEPYWGPFDNMQVGATGDRVMCEFWSGGHPFFDSPKFVSSIAHLNGHPVAGAESFTGIGGWVEHPARLKAIGDKTWAQGINQYIFHSYVHQPWNVGPGLALSYHGLEFNRLNTWWKPARSYLDYIARSQAVLQAGRSVNDVLVFVGASSPNSTFLLPEVQQAGYDYDLAGVHDLMQLTVTDGILRSPGGSRYEVLVLPSSSWMQPETLRKLAKLAEAGASIIGPRPVKSPSLMGYPQCDKEVQRLADQLWGQQLIQDQSITDYLSACPLPSMVRVLEKDRDDLSFTHRQTETADIFFVANSRREARQLQLQLRSSGKTPEFWDARTGSIRPATVWEEQADGTTVLPVALEAEASVFVVFRSPAAGGNITTLQQEPIILPSKKIPAPPAPLPELEIVRATYGTFLQAGLVDITEKVKAKVRGNYLSFRMNRQFCDCDPAMGYKKTLRLEYQIGNEVRQLVARELEEITIGSPEEKDKLVIRKAVFGKFLPETKGIPAYFAPVEITDKIRDLVAQGIYRIGVNEALLDGETVGGNAPELKITFRTQGETYEMTIPEGRTLELTQSLPQPRLLSQAGEDFMLTPKPIRYQYERKNGDRQQQTITEIPAPLSLSGPWQVAQLDGNGRRINQYTITETPDLWNQSDQPHVQHFSGTASYTHVVNIPDSLLHPAYELELDLGTVWVIAEVRVNDKAAGTAWKAPFRLPLTDLLRSGPNRLEILVTNLWPNRLIKDEQYPEDYQITPRKLVAWPEWLHQPQTRPTNRTTFATWQHWQADSPLLPSGLSGPVRINVYRKVKLK